MTERERHEKEVALKKVEHMRRVAERQKQDGRSEIVKLPWQPCVHDNCSECHGTYVKLDGTSCIHMISCPCPKCSNTYMYTAGPGDHKPMLSSNG